MGRNDPSFLPISWISVSKPLDDTEIATKFISGCFVVLKGLAATLSISCDIQPLGN